MNRSGLLVYLASVFAGLTVFLTVLGFVYSPVALVLALPFGVVTYLMWYQASGRLRERVRQRVPGATTSGPETGGFGAGPREEWTGPRRGDQRFGAGTRTGGSSGRSTGRGASRRTRTGPSTTEAYRTLGLDPGADEAAVRSAYRAKVKEVHPDTEQGDERAFKRVQNAYERLSD